VKGNVATEHPRSALDQLAEALRTILGAMAVRANEPLARYTALSIGGPADLLAVVKNAKMLSQIVALAWEAGVPCRVLGSGSNVLVNNGRVRGLVVLNRAQAVTFMPSDDPVQREEAGAKATAESGASFSTLAQQSAARGLAGLEWAVGIPGTVGGAVVGNAGAWGGDVASTLIQAAVLEPGGEEVLWTAERFEYAYRSSRLKRQSSHGGPRAIVLEAQFSLHAEDHTRLEARVAEIKARRRASQPAGASCGSVFKNPPGDHAGRLIEAAGLKGRRHGGAEISRVHANFVINRGGATADDVRALVDLAQQAVESQFGVALELEIELIGEWNVSAPEAMAGGPKNRH
jgi:UDP-N-acetylmuramate dehydrogenase